MKPGLIQYAQIAGMAVAARFFKRRYPCTLYVAITDRCPMKCAYCAVPGRSGTDLPTDFIIKAVREASTMGMRRLQLVGGEPLLHDGFAEIVAEANRRGVLVTVTTSGTLIERSIGALKGVDVVFVSLDGDQKAHAAHRGPGVWERVMDGIERLRAEKIRYWTTTVVTKKNRDSLDFIIDFARAKGHLANFQLLYTTGEKFPRHFHHDRLPGLALSHEEAASVCRDLLARKSNGAPIGSSALYFKHLCSWPDLQTIYSTDRRGSACLAGRMYCYLDTDGKLYPCGDAVGRCEGSAAGQGFAKTFERLSPPPCASCIIACNVEQNLLFSLQPGALLNWIGPLGKP